MATNRRTEVGEDESFFELKCEPNGKWHHLIQEANSRTVEDLNSNFSSSPLPDWVDSKAIIAGKKFVSRHFFLVFFTHFISLILLLSYVPVRAILMKTKKSHTVELALTRYVSTLRHIKLWYEGDLTSPDSEAVMDIIKIRKVHSGVAKRLKSGWKGNEIKSNSHSDLKKCQNRDAFSVIKCKSLLYALNNVFSMGKECNNNNDDNLRNSITVTSFGISQLDMMVTQYCFMGLLTSFPHKFGIDLSKKSDADGLKGFVHIWAIIGYVLGIEDKYNLGIGNKSALKTVILNDILLKDLAATKLETLVLWEALVDAISTFVPCISLHAALLFVLSNIVEIKSSTFLYKDAKFYDKFCYYVTIFLVKVCFQKVYIQHIRFIFNSLLRLSIYTTAIRIGLIKIGIQAA